MTDTSIPWTDKTWNPIRARDRVSGRQGHHCEHMSPACGYCYAEGMNRWRGTGARYLKSLRKSGRIEVYLHDEKLLEPLRWKGPRMIFPCSMTDIAGEFVPFDWLDAMFGVMALASQHRYQVLTKRPDRLREWFFYDRPVLLQCVKAFYDAAPADAQRRWPFDAERLVAVGERDWPLPHVLIGTSVEDRRRFRERMPIIREIPAATRWLSVEPLLEDLGDVDLTGIDWVVCGGLNGPRAFDLAWARRLLAQCREQGVPFFMKQIGSHAMRGKPELRDHKGEEPANWPPDLRVREWPPALTEKA